jgi:polysaccharide deacetylase 2 family uncharacterized protein YibQ
VRIASSVGCAINELFIKCSIQFESNCSAHCGLPLRPVALLSRTSQLLKRAFLGILFGLALVGAVRFLRTHTPQDAAQAAPHPSENAIEASPQTSALSDSSESAALPEATPTIAPGATHQQTLAHTPPEQAVAHDTGASPAPQVGAPGLSHHRVRPATQGHIPISVVVFGLERHWKKHATDSQHAAALLEALPPYITLALSPVPQHTPHIAQTLHARGFEIIAHIGLEPVGFPECDPGPNTLLINHPEKERTTRLQWALQRVPFAVGVTHSHGSAFTTNKQAMSHLLSSLQSRGGIFLDTLVTPYTCIDTLSYPTAMVCDFVLPHFTAMHQQWGRLLHAAQIKGRLIIGVQLTQNCHTRLKQLDDDIRAAHAQGIHLVPLSSQLRYTAATRSTPAPPPPPAQHVEQPVAPQQHTGTHPTHTVPTPQH